MLKFFNTKTRKIEEFTPLAPPNVGMYSCGPTVYSTPHIGNLRAYVFVDTLRRTLEANGYGVLHVMNITDVGHLFEEGDEARFGEDKLEYEARKEKMSAWDIAKKYTEEFLEAVDSLNIKRPTIMPKATEHIKEQIQLIEKLEERGFTYKLDDGIYFDTSKFPKYNLLAGGGRGIKPGARVEMVPGKKSPTDFALWKFTPSGARRQMEWDSPWGKGFPGWHIECSAMSMKYLGETFDIHTGGIDHIPVHHTNEITQSEAVTGQEFVRFWLHNEFILVEGKKMSKSLGNVYTLQDIKNRGFNPRALRYLFLTAHYRDILNFTWAGLQGAQTAYERLVDQVSSIKYVNSYGMQVSRKVLSQDKFQSIEKLRLEFFNQMNKDLGTPGALAVVWEMLKSNIPSKDKYELILTLDEILGLDLGRSAKGERRQAKVPGEVVKLVGHRDKLREEKKWLEADELRSKIEKMGYTIEDASSGPKVKAKRKLPNA